MGFGRKNGGTGRHVQPDGLNFWEDLAGGEPYLELHSRAGLQRGTKYLCTHQETELQLYQLQKGVHGASSRDKAEGPGCHVGFRC